MTIISVFAALGVCVGAMAVGVMFGRKPIKHCGNAVVNGKKVSCALCGNTDCKNRKAETEPQTVH